MTKCLTIAALVVFGAAFSTYPAAQEPLGSPLAEEESEAQLAAEASAYKLLQQLINDAGSLRIWENRSLVYASAGDILWDADQKQARKLFRSAADELLNAASEPVRKSSSDFMDDWTARERFSSRRPVLIIISERDADLALQMLTETRPPAIQLAMDRGNMRKPAGAQKTAKELEQERKDQQAVMEETVLEQWIARNAAEQDPSKAAAVIRKNIKSGINLGTFELLRKVNKTDADLASELVSEIIDFVVDQEFSENSPQSLWSAQSLLLEADTAMAAEGKNKSEFPVPEKSDLTRIAEKIADHFIGKTDYNQFWGFIQLMPVLEKYAPSKSDAISAKKREIMEKGPDFLRAYHKGDELLSDKSKTAEDLVIASRDFTRWQRSQILNKAVEKAEAAGTLGKLRNLLKAEAPGDERDAALAAIDSKLARKAIKDGELEGVRDLIDTAEDRKSRIRLTVDLALSFENEKTEESHEKAIGLMDDVSRLVSSVPEDKDEGADMLTVASGYAEIEPKSAFPYLEGLTVMANDLLLADSLRAKYDKRSTMFIENEVIFSQHVTNDYTAFTKALASLAVADFERTLRLADNFRRDDIKILLKLLLVQAVIKEKIGFTGNRVSRASFSSY